MSGMIRHLQGFTRARDGSVMVEFTIIVSLLLTVTGGMVDFSLALYQWNAAAKAVELGGRIAAVSSPVASNLATYVPVSGFPTAFSVVCSGATGTCTGGGTYDATAMQTIVFGQGKSACGAVAAGQLPAMCDAFPALTTSNVKVTYQQSAYATSGLGYSGRKLPVPTISVETTGLTFSFFFLNALLGLAPMTIPLMTTTITSEDLSSNCGGTGQPAC